MAKKKTKTVKKTEPDYLISPERKVTILGVGLALVSVFVFISILSYSPYDDFIADYGFLTFSKFSPIIPSSITRSLPFKIGWEFSEPIRLISSFIKPSVIFP